jgi:hypothetical protein
MRLLICSAQRQPNCLNHETARGPRRSSVRNCRDYYGRIAVFFRVIRNTPLICRKGTCAIDSAVSISRIAFRVFGACSHLRQTILCTTMFLFDDERMAYKG